MTIDFRIGEAGAVNQKRSLFFPRGDHLCSMAMVGRSMTGENSIGDGDRLLNRPEVPSVIMDMALKLLRRKL